MAVLVPNVGANELGMTVLDTEHLQAIQLGVLGVGIRSGGALSVTSENTGLAVAYTASVACSTNRQDKLAAAGSVNIATGAGLTAGFARRDWIVQDYSTGAVSVVAGTASEYTVATGVIPDLPAIPVNKVPLGTYFMKAGESTVNSNRLTDCRMFINGQRLNLRSPATGVTGDGVTDDAAAIDALFTNGGSWYAPSGTYLIKNPGITVALTASLDVQCADNAVFKAHTDLDSSMFDWTTNFGGLYGAFKWRGGIFDLGQQYNTTVSPNIADYPAANPSPTGNAVADGFNFSSGAFFSQITITDTVWTSRTGSYVAPALDPAYQHWLTGGGDSHILLGLNDQTSATLANNTHFGARDAAVYVTASGTDTQITGRVDISNCRFYWCMQGVAGKRGVANLALHDCTAYQTAIPYSLQQTGSTTRRAKYCEILNCTAIGAYRAFDIRMADKVAVRGCRSLDGGHVNAAGAIFTGPLASGLTGLNIEAATEVKVGDMEISGTDAAYTAAKPTGVKITSGAITGRFTLTGGTSGTITSITVNGNEVLNGTVTYATSKLVTHQAIATSINAKADAYTASGVNEGVYILGGGEGHVVAFTVTGALTASKMDCTGSATTGVTINGLYVDNIEKFGGEVAVTGATNPDYTRILGAVVGPGTADPVAITLLGTNSSVDYQDVRRKFLTSNITLSREDLTAEDVTGLAAPYQKNAWYRVTAMLHCDTVTEGANDAIFSWSYSGTPSGRFVILGASSGATAVTNTMQSRSQLWSDTSSALVGFVNDAPLQVMMSGLFQSTASGVLQLRWRKQATTVASTHTMYASSELMLERIG